MQTRLVYNTEDFSMKHIIDGINKFQKDVYPTKKETFEELAKGQSPEVLFITCADSRIDPGLMTQADPGELFVCRNAGNVVPPHSAGAEGMKASIEFAIQALGVQHVVVCGHSDCGAMKGAMNPEGLNSLPHVKSWLGHCSAAAEVVKHKHGGCDLDHTHLDEVTKENVKLQLQHLKTHPAVASKLATGSIELHGWVLNIGTGEIECLDLATGEFNIMDESYAAQFEGKTSVAA